MINYLRPEILERAAEILDRPGYGLCRGYFAATVEDPMVRWSEMRKGNITDGLSATGFPRNGTEVATIALPEATHFCIQGLWARAFYEIEGSLDEIITDRETPFPHLSASLLNEFIGKVRPEVEKQPSFSDRGGVIGWNNHDARSEEVQAVLRATAERLRAEANA